MKKFILKDNDGSEFDLFEYQNAGYLVLIFFRGAWCGHCKKQLVELNDNFEEFAKLNTKLVAISSDTAFKSSLLKTFLRLKFPVLSDTKLEMIEYFNFKTVHDNQIVSKPAVLLFNSEHEQVIAHISENYDERIDTMALINEIKQLKS
jgi:peroxiredoxin